MKNIGNCGRHLPARRLWLGSALSLALVMVGCAASDRAMAQPSHTISAGQIQEAVAQKFPRKYSFSGLMNLALSDPQIHLRPERNRLNTVLAVVASGPLLQARNYQGALDVDFSLRYEASDRTLRATDLQVNGLRMEGLNPQAESMLQQYGTTLAQRSLQEVVLYQLTDKDLALVNGLGLEPGKFTVTPKGLVITLQNKPVP
ncbi:DUF1439 domain-containing protein [Diaphorobacter aerolatus]|uniref:DUF1439 domain-containing protein n=1 Tax=Diaphorobacter aerolatus TaxID=1288495 RepID=A0A7H0GGX1_9BURK|nr:DUF1439 domain-containing protein [Diaphorobacter aerolatus]QNP47537.1 DUF1439 domain-containing protein [Diaphorobacter aerolatus]